MKNRIKELRSALGLTQEKFGSKINVKQATVAAYECGARTPIDAVVGSICKQYRVNEEWLRNGNGEMFCGISRSDEIAEFIGRILGDDEAEFQRNFVSALAKLDVEEWAILEKFVKDAAGLTDNKNEEN